MAFAKLTLAVLLTILTQGCAIWTATRATQGEAGGSALADCAPTLAALRALPAPSAPRALLLAGYHAPDDGGGGLFHWSPSCTDPDDGGLTVTPDAAPTCGRWKRLVTDGRYNVRWFGARGAGTDDTTAIQAAVDALPARGGTVYFPGGDYHTFPAGLAFYDCSIASIRVEEDATHTIRRNYLYGYGTYDNERLPDHPVLIGITDDGRPFHLQTP